MLLDFVKEEGLSALSLTMRFPPLEPGSLLEYFDSSTIDVLYWAFWFPSDLTHVITLGQISCLEDQ